MIPFCGVEELPTVSLLSSTLLAAGTFRIRIGPAVVSITTRPVPSPRILRLDGTWAPPIVNGAYVPGVTQTTEFGCEAASIAAWIVANGPPPPTFMTLPGSPLAHGVVQPLASGTSASCV